MSSQAILSIQEQSLIVNPQGGGHYQGVEVCNDCRALAEGKYDSVKSKIDLARAYETKKHVTDYVFSDSKSKL